MCAACAACTARSAPSSTTAVYREMRVAEADLERSDARLRADPEGRSAQALSQSVCDAAARVCALADAVAEADARARCDMARRRCAETGAPGDDDGDSAP